MASQVANRPEPSRFPHYPLAKPHPIALGKSARVVAISPPLCRATPAISPHYALWTKSPLVTAATPAGLPPRQTRAISGRRGEVRRLAGRGLSPTSIDPDASSRGDLESSGPPEVT